MIEPGTLFFGFIALVVVFVGIGTVGELKQIHQQLKRIGDALQERGQG